MNKKEIIDYFDSKAAIWDSLQNDSKDKIDTILTLANIGEGNRVLDVACGTGVLFDALLERKVKLTAIDISPKMCAIAREKYKDKEVEIINADVEEYPFNTKFDRIIVYNAFPHFISPVRLITHLATLLSTDGLLVIAHSMGRKMIMHHHKGIKEDISRDLISAEECAHIFSSCLECEMKLSNDDFYFISGRKKEDKLLKSC